MHKNNINICSLLQYVDVDSNIIYGIITKQFDSHSEIPSGEMAVEVFWLDDGKPTIETVREIRNSELEYVEVISEG